MKEVDIKSMLYERFWSLNLIYITSLVCIENGWRWVLLIDESPDISVPPIDTFMLEERIEKHFSDLEFLVNASKSKGDLGIREFLTKYFVVSKRLITESSIDYSLINESDFLNIKNFNEFKDRMSEIFIKHSNDYLESIENAYKEVDTKKNKKSENKILRLKSKN